MNENELPPNGTRAGVFRITIELPSLWLSKTENGYLVASPDGTVRHLTDCSDLWDVANNLYQYLHLTPSLLGEIHDFRTKCAELNWDDDAVANYYAVLKQKAAHPQQTDERGA
ncbi:MAG TPA: hypothetical protein VG733_09795 [Chthoniobacteraceae bacterium]|nr:hypothetical protein [Chthoniobacteraceae bacterium]